MVKHQQTGGSMRYEKKSAETMVKHASEMGYKWHNGIQHLTCSKKRWDKWHL
jgi:hypothetical protein